jgi:hypothetical protein
MAKSQWSIHRPKDKLRMQLKLDSFFTSSVTTAQSLQVHNPLSLPSFGLLLNYPLALSSTDKPSANTSTVATMASMLCADLPMDDTVAVLASEPGAAAPAVTMLVSVLHPGLPMDDVVAANDPEANTPAIAMLVLMSHPCLLVDKAAAAVELDAGTPAMITSVLASHLASGLPMDGAAAANIVAHRSNNCPCSPMDCDDLWPSLFFAFSCTQTSVFISKSKGQVISHVTHHVPSHVMSHGISHVMGQVINHVVNGKKC